MPSEMGASGYSTGRAKDREIVPDSNWEERVKLLFLRQRQLTAIAQAKAEAQAKDKPKTTVGIETVADVSSSLTNVGH